jgi:uroporphyrinogen III methyltransferase/synthase
MPGGKVYLVGAGPGDPGLLTLRGRELLEAADLVVYDALANPMLLGHLRPGARRIFAGRRGARAAARQRRIDSLLAGAARRGLQVVRLKGGDPFVFGRGGEEAEALAAAGIDFEIVPGVSSAVAAASCAGIPLTHRRHASSILIATGHEEPGRPASRLRWEALARGADTLVFLMAIRNLESILIRLARHGRPLTTPAALIEWGSWPRQRVQVATIGTLARLARETAIGPPALLVIGDVVRLRGRLRWLERRPLHGRRIVVTRPRAQAAELSHRLAGAGAEVIEFPTIEIGPPASWRRADASIRRLGEYDWILFTSANGVEAFLGRLWSRGKDLRALGRARLGAIGPATARALEVRGLRVEVQPDVYRAERVAAALRGRVRGSRVLIPRARVARDVLPRQLRDREGARVDVVEVYRTRTVRSGARRVREALKAGDIDAVTFTSSSTAHGFVRALGVEGLRRLMAGVAIACIGPVTAATLRSYGLKARVQPAEYTVPALAEALCRHFRSSRAGIRQGK